jgi:hypothetical protein
MVTTNQMKSKIANKSPIVSEKENEMPPTEEGQEEQPKQRDMSHVENYLNELDDEEAAHAHEHLKKRIEPKPGDNVNEKQEAPDMGEEPSYSDFQRAKDSVE